MTDSNRTADSTVTGHDPASVIRVDKSELLRVERTPEGYLRGDAVVTRTGVFRYINADGSDRYELRHPDDILSADSLDTLSGLPITIDHPTELVNADNAAALSVGLTGDRARVDGQNIAARINVTHVNGVKAVDDGFRELSLGYKVELVREDGVYNGQSYTHRQTNVRYNHLALVPRARVGAIARINLDGAAVQSDVTTTEDNQMSDTKLVTVNLDGLDYQAAPEVSRALQAAQKRADEAEKERDDEMKTKADMQKKYDELMAECDELKAKMDEMEKDNSDSAVAEAAKARVALIAKAGKVVENTDSLLDKSDRQIMEAVITARHDKLDLSKQSDDYVRARFDSVIESEQARTDKTKANARTMGARTDAAPGQPDARNDAAEAIRNQWKTKTEEAAQ